MQWEKMGQVFDPRNSGMRWMAEFAQAPATLVLNDAVRVYFSCRAKPEADGQYISRLGYVELDRTDLTSIIGMSKIPVMELGGLGEFDEFGTYIMSVTTLPGFYGGPISYYAGFSRRTSTRFDTAIGMAHSEDGGETFQKLGKGPVIGASITEPYVLSGPKVRKFGNRYYMFYIAGSKWTMMDGRTEPVYKIRLATSTGGLIWTCYGRNLIEDALGEDEAQSGPDVHLGADGIYHMFFCFRPVGHHPGRDGGLRIGYAYSDDLLHWTRDDARAGITVSDDPAAWDYGMVRYPHVFWLDGREYMLYNGNEFGRWGFGLARRIA